MTSGGVSPISAVVFGFRANSCRGCVSRTSDLAHSRKIGQLGKGMDFANPWLIAVLFLIIFIFRFSRFDKGTAIAVHVLLFLVGRHSRSMMFPIDCSI